MKTVTYPPETDKSQETYMTRFGEQTPKEAAYCLLESVAGRLALLETLFKQVDFGKELVLPELASEGLAHILAEIASDINEGRFFYAEIGEKQPGKIG